MANDSYLMRPHALLAEMLSNCDEFLLFTGEATAAAAKTHIYDFSLTPPANNSTHSKTELETARPFVIVSTQAFAMRRVATETWAETGVLLLEFERDVPAVDLSDLAQAYIDFSEMIGHIVGASEAKPSISGLTELAHEENYLALDNITMPSPVALSDDLEQDGEGTFLYCWLELSYGVNA